MREINFLYINLFVRYADILISAQYTIKFMQAPALREERTPVCFNQLMPMIYSCAGLQLALDTVHMRDQFAVVGGIFPERCMGYPTDSTDLMPSIILFKQPTFQIVWKKYFNLPLHRLPAVLLSPDESSIAVLLNYN